MSFKGKVVLITGSSSGIGAETARYFAKEGAILSLAGRNFDNLTQVGKECGDDTLLIQGDLNSELNIEKMVETTIKKYGKIDVLVNNAGIYQGGSIETTTLESFDLTFSINVRAVFYLSKLAVPYLIQTKGCIVNVSSISGLRSFPNMISYCVSKSAVDQLTKCMALDLASKGVRVNSVNPGTVLTEIQRRSGMDEEAIKLYMERAKYAHALGRAGETWEIADAIGFLASERASFITGVNLPVDGGRAAMTPHTFS